MYNTIDALFTGICDAIRSKDGTTEPIPHQDIPARIENIRHDDTGSKQSGGIIFVEIQKPDIADIKYVTTSEIKEEEIIWNLEL